jgi:dihydroxyacid dehydratase/phosphogluconate dehydratase
LERRTNPSTLIGSGARGTADSNDTDAESKGESAKSKGTAAWKPANRTRKVSQALQAYAALTTSASRGAVRDVSRIQKSSHIDRWL